MAHWLRPVATVVLCWCVSACLQFRVLHFFANDFYPNDTFFQLSVPARMGLVVLCVAVIGMALLGILWGAFKASGLFRTFDTQHPHRAPRWVTLCGFVANLAIVLVLLVLLSSLSPQILYSYYQFVFSDLPQQWVIDQPSLAILRLTFGQTPINSLNQAISVVSITSALVLVTYAWFWSAIWPLRWPRRR